jgi:hypothetical protein
LHRASSFSPIVQETLSFEADITSLTYDTAHRGDLRGKKYIYK